MTAITTTQLTAHARADRIGIMASILCAIHCALTPVLLIMMPSFGKAWAHPSTHWGMAIIVIPIAIFMMRKGYQKHGKKWIVATGSLGICFIVVGAILPYVEFDSSNKKSTSAATIATPDEIAAQPESGVCEQSAAAG